MKSCQRIFGGAHSRPVATVILLVLVVVQLLTFMMPTAYAAGGGQLPSPNSSFQAPQETHCKDAACDCGGKAFFHNSQNWYGYHEWKTSTGELSQGRFYYRVASEGASQPDKDGSWYYAPGWFDGLDSNSVIGCIHTYASGGFLCAAAFSIACAAQGVHPTLSIASIGCHIFSVLNLQDAGGQQSIISVCTIAYEHLAVIGLLLVILYFIIDVLDEMQADHFTVDHLIKKLITMAVAILVISQGAEIFATIIHIGEGIMYDVAEAFKKANNGTIANLQITYEKMMYADGFMAFVEAMGLGLGLILDNIIAYILSYVALLFAYLTAFSRFLEIMIRFAMAPIGLAPLVSGGAKGSGMRYLKKFASVCLQGAVCVAALASATILSSMMTGLSAVIGQVLIPLTLIGFMSKTQGIADDIVGV